MVLLLWNVGKYEFLTEGNVLLEKGLVEKATTYEHSVRQWVEKTKLISQESNIVD